MRINAMFLANEAEVTNDRLSVSEGVWDGLQASSWPAGHPIKVVLLLAPTSSDVGVDLPVTLKVTAGDGSDAGSTEGTARIGVQREQVPVVLPVQGSFAGPGRFTVAVSVGEAHASTSFVVRGPAGTVLGALPGLDL